MKQRQQDVVEELMMIRMKVTVVATVVLAGDATVKSRRRCGGEIIRSCIKRSLAVYYDVTRPHSHVALVV
ncbi:hypothetical protein M8C21_005425 [Ambrosia artemisiifolia]|uniref:Uncharacterized protein n=1 Tax=Ambrosia artemisiifolia TaxID=4212 RepID=A0AAD5DC87_AMBAR|nr:hypothetical protein M8C21_005425 [Ambrosia artemisiifolia]